MNPACTVNPEHHVDDPAAYACRACTAATREDLHAIANLAADAQDAADGFARYGTPGPSRGGDDDRAPINLGATRTLAAAANTVTTWARHVSEQRGVDVPQPERRPVTGPGCPAGWCQHGSCRAVRTRTAQHPLAVTASWLAEQLDWLRHRQEAAEAYAGLRQAARDITRIADRPPDQVLVGVCDCGEWLYARAGRKLVRCRSCDQQWDVERSRDTLRAAMDDKLLTAAQIATVAARAGHDRAKVRNLVTTWGRRGVILARGDADGVPTYRLGDALARLDTQPVSLAG